MDDTHVLGRPPQLDAIERDSAAIGFGMASEEKTGGLLRALAASKPGSSILELGTGTGVGTAWLLAGMDAQSTLVSVDNDAKVQAVARRYLEDDPRVTFVISDGAAFLETRSPHTFDLIFADTWAGKFTHLDEALDLVRVGGIYVVDDLLPQANWPAGHGAKVPPLIHELETHPDFAALKLAWASGLMVLVRTR
jgi:predicted O-methyltransferase YrrM